MRCSSWLMRCCARMGRCGRCRRCRWWRSTVEVTARCTTRWVLAVFDVQRLRTVVASTPIPRAADGRIVLAVDVTCWLRPEAHTVPQQILCHTHGRGKDQHIGVPGWPYSFVVALESGRSSWTAPLDAIRLSPGADLAAVTAEQVRAVVDRLIAAGHWEPGDPAVWVVMDAGYDAARLAWLLRDLPVHVLTRMRSDRMLRRRPRPWIADPTCGRPPRHGSEFIFGDPASWGAPDVTTVTETRLYGTATARAWHRLHPRLTRRAAWADCPDLPIPKAPSSVSTCSDCPPARPRNQSGCGGSPASATNPATTPTPPSSTCCGRRSCAVSTSSTPSGCSSKPSAGPRRNYATHTPPTAGPG